MPTKGLLIRLEVRKGKEKAAEQALKNMMLPTGTIACYTIHLGGNSYGIFCAFNSIKNRLFYLKSIAMKELHQQKGILFATAPTVERIDLLADKLPRTPLNSPDSTGLLITFKAKEDYEYKTEDFLRQAQLLVEEEPGTTSWFALSFDNGEYGIFDVFPDQEARLEHLTGRVPKKMMRRALSIFGSIPEMHLLTVLSESLATTAKMEAAFIQEEF